MPRCLIIAGPNDAGKTTFALKYLPTVARIDQFLNADMIASGLSPFRPEQQAAAAGRLFLAEIESHIATGQDFALETTLSGKAYLALIDRLRRLGWVVDLYYLALPAVEVSKRRVAERVAHGGHDIPLVDIERRFPRGLRNLLKDYRMRVDKCVCYMNDDDHADKIFEQAGDQVAIVNEALFAHINRLAGLQDE
ncbi:MAG: hypothetical protein JF615_00070 [Asticcacaulis sp.]|nr:hypothetical protein [Asticcacaulis sp.]